jgi:hypothetical protein
MNFGFRILAILMPLRGEIKVQSAGLPESPNL